MKEQISSQMTYQGLILSVVFIMLCRTEADTVTQKNVVKVGGNVTLSCLLMGSHDILQVTWQKKNTGVNENLATYSVSKGVNIVETYRGRLNFTRLSLNDTAITLWRVRIQDDGCYTCLFNTFPAGAIVQDTCLTVYADTVTQKNVVKVGGNVTLSCLLMGSHDILQVTWQKKNTGVNENLATYSVSKGVNIVETYRGRLNFTRLSLNDTAITLWRVRIQDDGCYTCLFNTFPAGAIVQDTFLTVYEQLRGSLHYVVSEGNLTATCSANAWPRPVISWIVPKAESEKTEEVVTHPNGTVSVISKLYVNSSTSLAGQLLICRVRHMEEDRDYSVKVKEGRWFSVPWLLTSVALLVVFVVLVLTVVCWRRRRKKQSESKAS
ncbi:OX-2 membrane glycoprotein-like isoform X2 [Terrapene carolina triunguis]|nr:OX-2 membrane glycoprotein-like isoform X2 [Terrapene carolina triunguis]